MEEFIFSIITNEKKPMFSDAFHSLQEKNYGADGIMLSLNVIMDIPGLFRP